MRRSRASRDRRTDDRTGGRVADGNHIFRRLLMLIPVVFLTVTLVFVLVRLLPGDLATLKLGGEANKEQVQAFRKQLGLDRPIAGAVPGFRRRGTARRRRTVTRHQPLRAL